MSLGIIDVREWQTTVDFETGLKKSVENEMTEIAKKVIAGKYYPGDLDDSGVEWIRKMAIELNEHYKPNLMFLDFAQAYFYSLYSDFLHERWREIVRSIFKNIEIFIEETGFTPVIVGLGEMTDIKGYIDISALWGLPTSTNWSYQTAGFYDVHKDEIEDIKNMPHVRKVISRDEFLGKYECSQSIKERFPEYLLLAEEGYTFKGFSSGSRRKFKIPAVNREIPVYNPLGRTESIIGIRGTIEKALPEKNIALIIVEGIGEKDFPYDYELCSNTIGSYSYENLENQYMAISTGKHMPELYFPPVHLYYEDDYELSNYPFSGAYNEMPQNTIGRIKGIKSAAVGTRGMVTHVASGADICIECFSRTLYNFGTMAIINDPK